MAVLRGAVLLGLFDNANTYTTGSIPLTARGIEAIAGSSSVPTTAKTKPYDPAKDCAVVSLSPTASTVGPEESQMAARVITARGIIHAFMHDDRYKGQRWDLLVYVIVLIAVAVTIAIM